MSTILFFVDDLHLSADSFARTHKTVLRFINEEMGQNDQALIVSTSGQTGFLGQLTDNKTVLRAAAARLFFHDRSTRDTDRPPMTEYQALAVGRQAARIYRVHNSAGARRSIRNASQSIIDV